MNAMNATIEVECKEPKLAANAICVEQDDKKDFTVKLLPKKNKLLLTIRAEDISALQAGINSYLRLIKTAIDVDNINDAGDTDKNEV